MFLGGHVKIIEMMVVELDHSLSYGNDRNYIFLLCASPGHTFVEKARLFQIGVNMLKALDERLKRLSKDPSDDFHCQIRNRIGKKATRLFEQRLKNLICLMPQLLSKGLAYCNRKEVPTELKRSIGFTLTYLYHPKDFLPEDNEKLFGYLDDAYCIGLVYEKVLRTLQKARVKLAISDEDFLKQFALMKRSVKAVIPEESKAISEMTAGVFKGNYQSFNAVFK